MAEDRQQGIALLETLIAIVVLMIGLLAVLATFAMAIGNTIRCSWTASPAKRQPKPWKAFSPRARPPDHLRQDPERRRRHRHFPARIHRMTDPGPDGWTARLTMFPQPIRLPGRAESSSTPAPRTSGELREFQRQIQITNVAGNPNVRQITVTVRYPVPQGWIRLIRCKP